MSSAVQQLEMSGFKVIAMTSDGASPNRKFYRMHGLHGVSQQQPLYKVHNHYSQEDRWIYDIPHLIKTIRNCWSKSFANSRTRELWVRFLLHGYNCFSKTFPCRSMENTLAGNTLLSSIDVTKQPQTNQDLSCSQS